MNEFALIDAYFKRLSESTGALLSQRTSISPATLGIGDDCALLSVPAGMQLAVSADTLIRGVHFPDNTAPFDIGYKSLAVNLSDLAAMGAEPAWFTLCITLNGQTEQWVEAFCAGMASVLQASPIQLIGGDTTRGALSISVQVMGLVPAGRALTRAGAQVGDDIYVSGCIGEAAVGLALAQGRAGDWRDLDQSAMLARLNRPQPRVGLGCALRDQASACIDVSDGLLADLNHVLVQSQVGASLDLDSIPATRALPLMQSITSGDDYELCFTAPPGCRDAIGAIAEQQGIALTRIGSITSDRGMRDRAGNPLTPAGYTHF